MTAAELRAKTRRAIQNALIANESWKHQSPEQSVEVALFEIEAAIDAEIAAARPQWQTIETAPKDGRCILLLSVESANWESGFWHDGSENYWHYVGWYAEEDRRNLVASRPMPGVTHWMPPLPKGPPR